MKPIQPKMAPSLLLTLLCLLGPGTSMLPSAARAAPPSEYQLKAVLLYNMARYTEWPQGTKRNRFEICVFGADPFDGSLELAVEKERLNGQPVRVANPRQLEQINDCHILFVAANSELDEIDLLRQIAGRPILTVGDGEDFIFNGGMVRFYNQGSKIRFAINPDAVREADLKVSANLLYIARIVRRPALAGKNNTGSEQ